MIVDEDHSELSRRIGHAFLSPYFQAPQQLAERDIVPLMSAGKYTFVLDTRSYLERTVLSGKPVSSANVDATVLVQVGLGADYRNRYLPSAGMRFVRSLS